MKTLLASFLAVYAGCSVASASVLTGFGTVGEQGASAFSVDGNTNFSYTAGISNITIAGNDGAQTLIGSFSPITFSIMDSVQLTATVSTNPASNFTLELLSGNLSRVYSGNLLSFGVNTPTTITLTYLSGPALTSVDGIQYTGGGTGLAAVNVTFDTLAAVPEPSTYLLLGVTFAGVMFISPRKRSQAQRLRLPNV